MHDLLGKIALAKKDYPVAISKFLAMSRAEPEEPDWWAYLTYACAQGGERKQALVSLAKLDQLGRKRYVAPYYMAIAWMGLGDLDRAIYFLNEAYRIKSSNWQPFRQILCSIPYVPIHAFKNSCTNWIPVRFCVSLRIRVTASGPHGGRTTFRQRGSTLISPLPDIKWLLALGNQMIHG